MFLSLSCHCVPRTWLSVCTSHPVVCVYLTPGCLCVPHTRLSVCTSHPVVCAYLTHSCLCVPHTQIVLCIPHTRLSVCTSHPVVCVYLTPIVLCIPHTQLPLDLSDVHTLSWAHFVQYVQLISGAFEYCVACTGNLCFGICDVLHCSLWDAQTINFPYTQHRMFKRNLKHNYITSHPAGMPLFTLHQALKGALTSSP